MRWFGVVAGMADALCSTVARNWLRRCTLISAHLVRQNLVCGAARLQSQLKKHIKTASNSDCLVNFLLV
jgi:hypothetical protein